MLVDDSADDNFFHTREMNKTNLVENVISKCTGIEALMYLKSEKASQDLHPELIFLDLNMPGMNGWEFLEEYTKLDKNLQSHAVIIMHATSENSNEAIKARAFNFVADFIPKPLTKDVLKDIDKYLK